jgi:hypothetical protein
LVDDSQIGDETMTDGMQEKFARLLALSTIQTARVKANPVPFLDDMTERYCRLRSAIDKALYEISGASAFEVAQEEFPHMHPSTVETAISRMHRAQKVLTDAIRGQDNDR